MQRTISRRPTASLRNQRLHHAAKLGNRFPVCLRTHKCVNIQSFGRVFPRMRRRSRGHAKVAELAVAGTRLPEAAPCPLLLLAGLVPGAVLTPLTSGEKGSTTGAALEALAPATGTASALPLGWCSGGSGRPAAEP